MSEIIQSTSKAVIKDELSRGFDPNYAQFVDGNPRKKLEDVNPFGTVEYIARQDISKALIMAYITIFNKSKIVTGNYSRNNVLFYNNEQIANTVQGLKDWLRVNANKIKSKDEFRFVNLAPYARKLERESTYNGSPKRIKNKQKNRTFLNDDSFKPNGAYALSAKILQRRLKGVAFPEFRFVDGGDITNLSGPNRTYKTDSGKRSRKGKPYFYPSIRMRIIGSGITNNGTGVTQ